MTKPTVSVITPTYRTAPNILARTFASLKSQTFKDWEWVVWDDTPNSDEVWRQLYGFAADERFRIRAFRSHTHSGSIGEVKRNAAMVAAGSIIVELDHDDELTTDCLAEVVRAFSEPQVGFVYSDWCELFADGSSGRYPAGWAFGFGSDYWSNEYGCWVMRAPAVNEVTMGHIVSAPNHVRAWRASVYRSLDGHDASLEVADDYELCVRTFLATRMVHVPRLLYRQHIGPTTAQRVRNGRIQEIVKRVSAQNAEAIIERAKELGISSSNSFDQPR